MKIKLIEPAMIKKSTGLSEKPIFCFQPLALGVLAGLTPPDIEVELVDDRFENVDYQAPCDLAAITVKTFTARRAYQIAARFRECGVPVIVGGQHVSLVPDEARLRADSVFVGEAELLWPAVLEDARNGRLQPVYQGGREACYPPIRINRDILNKKRYLPAALVETARGCRNNCSFCSVTAFFGHTFRRRPTGKLIEEVRALRQKLILFADDNIVGDVESAKELFAALMPLRIRWMGQASISMTRDPELMDLMRKSGCTGVLVEMDSLFGDNLKTMRKGWNMAQQDYDEALRITREHGIGVVGSFIVGLDHDTPDSLDATVEYSIRQKLFAVLFNMLAPFPGTDLYRQMEQEKRLRYSCWWLDPAYRYGEAVFIPRHFSPEELAQKRMEMYQRFYGASSVFRRLLDRKSNARDLWQMQLYGLINLPGLVQERARTGMRLGAQTE